MTDLTKFENPLSKGVSRRKVLVGVSVGSMALALGSKGVFAADGKTIKIGFISPRSGPLAGFGQTDGYILEQVRKALSDGYEIDGDNYAVEILDRDTQSDPARAGQLAKALINDDNVDLILTTSAPETVNPVSDACEAAGVPCLSTVTPWEAWYFGRGAVPGEASPFKWGYHYSFGVNEFYEAYISQWDLIETNKKVAVMYPNDADGNAIRAALKPRLEEAGYTIIDPGPYETGTTDFSSQIALFKSENCEIFNTFPIPPDFAAFWRQAAQQGYTRMVKICQVAKTGLFPSDIEALGSLGINIASAAYWHKGFPYKSSLTGLSGNRLADGFQEDTGLQWTQQLGATLAIFDAGFAALRASGNPNNKQAVADAFSTLNVTTIAGQVDFTSGPVPNVAIGPIIGSQWIKAPQNSPYEFDYVITENSTDPNVFVRAELKPYN